jgi:hypothetical protein
MGHNAPLASLVSNSEHSKQIQTCPHGKMTVLILFSKQILQSIVSPSSVFVVFATLSPIFCFLAARCSFSFTLLLLLAGGGNGSPSPKTSQLHIPQNTFVSFHVASWSSNPCPVGFDALVLSLQEAKSKNSTSYSPRMCNKFVLPQIHIVFDTDVKAAEPRTNIFSFRMIDKCFGKENMFCQRTRSKRFVQLIRCVCLTKFVSTNLNSPAQ